MASQIEEKSMPFPQDNANTLIIQQCLQEFGVPAQKVYKMIDVYYTFYDYMEDVKKFRENYDKFQQVESIVQKLGATENKIDNKLKILNDEILQKESWFQGRFGVCKIDTDKLDAAEATVEEMKQETKQFKDMFHSKEAVQEAADEVLNRKNVMRVIQLALVFKDVVIGVHKVVKTARELREYNQEFNHIHNEYIQPTIDQFNKDGTIDDDLVKRGIWMLKQLKKNIVKLQMDAKSSIITHGLNFVTLTLQAYATFNNVSLLTGIASKSALAFNYCMGVSQTGLAVGSLALGGIETYNHYQYASLIEKIEKCIEMMEDYLNYQKKAQ